MSFVLCPHPQSIVHPPRKIAEKERIDDLVDVFDRRIDHAARAARFWIERRFKERAEDGRRDVAPVELRRADKELADVVGDGWDVVGRECCQCGSVASANVASFQLGIGIGNNFTLATLEQSAVGVGEDA